MISAELQGKLKSRPVLFRDTTRLVIQGEQSWTTSSIHSWDTESHAPYLNMVLPKAAWFGPTKNVAKRIA